MHEWSLAQAVINSIADYCVKNNIKGSVKATVVLGELQQIDRGVFELSLKEILKEYGLKKIKIKTRCEKAEFRCRACNHKWSFSESKGKIDENNAELIHFVPEVSHAYMKCPKCKSPDFEIVKGRGVWIKEIEEIKEK